MPYSKLAEYYYQSYSNHHVQCCTLHIFIICCLLSVLPFLFFFVIVQCEVLWQAVLYGFLRIDQASKKYTLCAQIQRTQHRRETNASTAHSSIKIQKTKTRKSIFGTITTHRLWYYPFLSLPKFFIHTYTPYPAISL